jgi:hypothetical protein
MKLSVRGSSSPLGFATEGGGAWKEWDRFITIEGRKACHIGNVCGTCSFFFERHESIDSELCPNELQRELTDGIQKLEPSHAKALEPLLPSGDYEIMLRTLTPRLVVPGSAEDYFSCELKTAWGIDPYYGTPHNPKTNYYRGLDQRIGDDSHLFEFMIPMFPEGRLDLERVKEFTTRISNGRRPTALALSVLDIKQSQEMGDGTTPSCHWCLAHYLIDGHHKAFAAARANQPISLISMLAVDKGVSLPEQHEFLSKIIRSNSEQRN